MTTMATYLQPESATGMDNLTPSHSHMPHDHGSDHEPQLSAMATSGLIIAKVTAMVTLGIISFMLGLLPVKVAAWLRYRNASKVTISGSHGHSDRQQQPAVVSLLLCYGGGVLLYTTFLHLQPEVRESMNKVIGAGKLPEWLVETGLSLSDVVFCCGFFFVYLVEEAVHWLLDRHGEDHEEEEAVLHRTMSMRRCSRRHHHSSASNGGNMIPRATLSSGTANGEAPKSDSTENAGGSNSVTASTQGLLLRDQISVIDIKSSDHSPLDAQIRMTGGPLMEEPAKGFKGDIDDELLSRNSKVVAQSFRGLLAVMALSFHAIFEGLAVGLETSVRNVWYMFAAIATHKFVIAFCVGVGLVSSGTRLPLIIIYMATFAVVTPVGIGIGIALSDDGGGSGDYLLPVALQGMAAGTLLYVIFFEVLQRERNTNNQPGFLQLAAIIAGFSTMLILQLSLGHEHSHGSSGHSKHSSIADITDFHELNDSSNHAAKENHLHHYHNHNHHSPLT